MAEDPGTYTLSWAEPEPGSLTFSDQTRSDEDGIGSRLAEYEYPGLHGVEVQVLGDAPRALMLTARLHGATAKALQARKVEVNGARGKLCSFSMRGGEAVWQNVVIWGAPRFTERTPPQADGSVSCRVQLVLRQLIPADPAAEE